MGRSFFKYRLLIVFASALAALASRAGPRDGLPAIDTDEQKLKYLFYVNDLSPKIFDDAMVYDNDLFEVLEKQAALVTQFENDERFKALERGAVHERMRIDVTPTKSDALHVDEYAFEQMKNRLIERATGLTSRTLDAQLTAELHHASRVSTQGLITGLIKTLPKDRQGAVFKLPQAEKLKALADELPDELVHHGFNPAVFGVDSPTFNREEAVRLLRDSIANDSDLQNLALLRVVGLDKIRSLTPEQLHNAQTKETLRPLIEKLPESLRQKKIAAAIEQAILASPKASVPAPVPLSKKLKIEEMSSHVALFRGCVGGDCATQRSAPYPNSPMERVYYVSGKDGTLKGYVSGTIVKVDGKQSFYLHSVAGNFSAEDATTILHSFHDIREKLGVDQVVLPSDENLDTHVNSPVVREVLKDAVRGKPLLPIEYLDQEIRSIIDSEVDRDTTYDTARVNSHGRVFEPTSSRPSIQVEVTVSKVPPYQDIPLNRGRALQMAIGFQEAGKLKTVSRILVAANISRIDFDHALKVVENEERLPLAKYKEALNRVSTQWNVSLPEWLNERPLIAAKGRVAAVDAFAPPNIAETLKCLIAYLNSGVVDSKLNDMLLRDSIPQEVQAGVFKSLIRNADGAMANFRIRDALEDPRWSQNPYAADIPDLYIERASSSEDFLKNLYPILKADWTGPKTHARLSRILEFANTTTLEDIVSYAFAQPEIVAQNKDILAQIVGRSDSGVLRRLQIEIFNKPIARDPDIQALKQISRLDPEERPAAAQEFLKSQGDACAAAFRRAVHHSPAL